MSGILFCRRVCSQPILVYFASNPLPGDGTDTDLSSCSFVTRVVA